MVPFLELEKVTGVVIKICTPLRIRHGGKIIKSISFETLIRNITNRIKMITARYGGWIDCSEAERLQSLAAQVQTVKEDVRVEPMARYSNRAGRKMDFSGIVGELEYKGNLTPLSHGYMEHRDCMWEETLHLEWEKYRCISYEKANKLVRTISKHKIPGRFALEKM